LSGTKVSGIIAAAGMGRRMGYGKNKVFMDIAGIPMLVYTLCAFDNADLIDDIIVISNDTDYVKTLVLQYKITKFNKAVPGGETRQESVLKGIKSSSADIAAVHDGARALITPALIDKVVSDAIKYKAAALGVKCVDSLKRCENGFISENIERENIYNIQTPQVFNRKTLINAHERAIIDNISATDDTAIVCRYGTPVFITEGSYENIKLTTPSDIAMAEEILKRRLQ